MKTTLFQGRCGFLRRLFLQTPIGAVQSVALWPQCVGQSPYPVLAMIATPKPHKTQRITHAITQQRSQTKPTINPAKTDWIIDGLLRRAVRLQEVSHV